MNTASSSVLQAKIADLEQQLVELGQNYSTALAECERLRQTQAENPLPESSRQATALADLLDGFSSQLFALPGVDGCAIYLLNNAGTALITADLRLQEGWGAIQKAYKGFHQPTTQIDVNLETIRRGETILITKDNHTEFGDLTRARFENMGMESLLVLPITVRQDDGQKKTIGAVSVFSNQQRLELALGERIRALAAPFALQIEAPWSQHQIVEWGKTVQVMYSEIQQHIAFITEMNSVVAVDQVYALIGERFIKRFAFDLVSILLAKDDMLTITNTSFSPPFQHLATPYGEFQKKTHYSISQQDGSSTAVFVNKQRFLFDDIQKIVQLPMTPKDRESLKLLPNLRTLLLVPILFKNQPIGVLCLGTLSHPVALSDSDLALIELLASYVSTAIRNAQAHGMVERQKEKIERLNRDLERKVVLLGQMARKDKLTGLNNFGSFEEELRQRTQESQRQPEAPALSAILIDVDHFKRFNDTFGHPAGNQVLQEVAARILKSVRDFDFVARYGGEEFIVLLPNCPLAKAHEIAERIRQKIANSGFVVDAREHQVTISGGCTQFALTESAGDFVRRADTALYSAKQNGRNRIEILPCPE